jgi:Mg2+ and Co2+ transporter CorA
MEERRPRKPKENIGDEHGDPGEITPFQSSSVRCQFNLRYNSDTPQNSSIQSRSVTSSLEAFNSLMTRDVEAGKPPDTGDIIFQILYRDTLALVQVMRSGIAETRAQIVDIADYELQRNSLHWRSLLARFHYELQQMADEMSDLFDFLYGDSAPAPERTQTHYDEGRKLLKETSDQVDHAHDYLQKELDMLERRRSIEQAESVANLTELAFVFIPLTYTAGIFSMQVRELQDSPPPTFPVTFWCLSVCCVFPMPSVSVYGAE